MGRFIKGFIAGVATLYLSAVGVSAYPDLSTYLTKSSDAGTLETEYKEWSVDCERKDKGTFSKAWDCNALTEMARKRAHAGDLRVEADRALEQAVSKWNIWK
tara:strand:- start:610 stop:915 length:306 start_codon:yes stop_codon:yes gene_type:complete